jgi:sugar O-acyltransferase (sialic acid O-acetyltransferase NeuD family)
MNDLVGVYGASGFGREVMSFVAPMLPTGSEALFIDDQSENTNGRYPVLTFEQFTKLSGQKSIIIAIADSRIRQALSNRCKSALLPIISIQARTVVIGDDVLIGSGSILCNFVTVTTSAKIGESFHANIYSYVAHDCVIGDFVTFAPSVKCNGNVIVEDHAYIGTGAILKQGRPDQPLIIGRGAVIGMGAVVTKNVPAGCTVVGNPARPIERASS